MSQSDQLRRDRDRKRNQRIDAEKKAGEFRIKESTKRADADKARQAANRASSATTARTRLREADRRDGEAATAGKEANGWQTKASRYAKEEHVLVTRLARAELSENQAAERRRQREQQQTQQRAAAERAALQHRVERAEAVANDAVRHLREPKPEHLRILMLGASAAGGLRIGREQQRIRNAVQSAAHRDLVDFDPRPAATVDDSS